MALSAKAQEALCEVATGEVFVYLLTITHPSLPNPIYLSSDCLVGQAATVSNGISFLFLPFSLVLPTDMSDRPQQAKIILDAVDLTMIQAVRSCGPTVPPTIVIQVVLASQPNVIEFEFTFYMRDFAYDASTISATLAADMFLNEPYPGDQVTPALFPGVFE